MFFSSRSVVRGFCRGVARRLHAGITLRRSPAPPQTGRTLSAIAALTILTGTLPFGVAAQVPSGAESDPILLPEVVITATASPAERTTLPTSVTLLQGATLREQGIRTVDEALRLSAGLSVVRAGSEGAQTSLFMRGGESDYVKILVDGVPVNQAGGAVDLADLSTAQVERIEIVRGPAGVLYGSDAVSGVVQIFTRRGRGAPVLDLSLGGGQGTRTAGEGSYGVMDFEGTASGSTPTLSYTLGGSHSTSDGLYALNNDRRVSTLNARLGWEAKASTSFSLAARFSDGVSHFPTDDAGNPVDANAYLDRRLLTVSIGATHRFAGGFNLRLELGHASGEQGVVNERDSEADPNSLLSTGTSTRTTADLRVGRAIADGTITAGVGFEHSAAEFDSKSTSVWGPFEGASENDRTNRSVYAEYMGAPFGGVSLTLGGRLDRNETFGTFETFRVGFTRAFGDATRIRGVVGRAFREPTFGENFGSGFGDVGAPDLNPERTASWEVGIERNLGPVRISVTWFDQRFTDLIQYTSASTPNYVNVGEARAAGLELGGGAIAGPIALEGTFTHLATEVLDPGLASNVTFVEGEALLRRPANSGSLTARWAPTGGSLSAALHFVGEREDVDFTIFPNERVTLESYTTLDLAGELELPFARGAGARGWVRIENLLDTGYEGIYGFRAVGRVVRAGARFRVGG